MDSYSLVGSIQVATEEIVFRCNKLVLAGRKFRLSNGRSNRSRVYGVFACDCGEHCVKLVNDVLTGKTKSCGCYRKESCVKNSRCHKHGMHKSAEFRCWVNMKQRCYNRNHNSFKDYGGRGISVCERWISVNGFQNFVADMGKRPSREHSIDRIDNNKGYSPENCRWSSRIDQASNKRNNRLLKKEGHAMTVAQWARRLGVPVATLSWRIQNGWPDEKVLKFDDNTSFGVRVE